MSEGYTLLVVEDDPNHQLLIKRALGRAEGLFSIVEFAPDIREAERFAGQMEFDCFLVDNQLPGGRGLDFIASMRERGVDGPFVLMTSAGSEDLVIQAFRRQVSDYLAKDVGFWHDLPAILRRAMEASEASRASESRLDALEQTNVGLDEVNTTVQMQFEKLRLGRQTTRELIATAIEEVDTLAKNAGKMMKPADFKAELKKVRKVLVQAASMSRQPED